MSEGPTSAHGDQTTGCWKCDEQISAAATFTPPLVCADAKAILDPAISGFTAGFLVLAMVGTLLRFVGYVALVRRRKSPAEEGVTRIV